jgi:hypothetical protein
VWHPIPCGVFKACQEARGTALKCYSPAFASRLRKPIYFDSQNDTLFFEGPGVSYHFRREGEPCSLVKTANGVWHASMPADGLDKICHLFVRIHSSRYSSRYSSCYSMRLNTFENRMNLKTMTLVQPRDVYHWMSRELALQ